LRGGRVSLFQDARGEAAADADAVLELVDGVRRRGGPRGLGLLARRHGLAGDELLGGEVAGRVDRFLAGLHATFPVAVGVLDVDLVDVEQGRGPGQEVVGERLAAGLDVGEVGVGDVDLRGELAELPAAQGADAAEGGADALALPEFRFADLRGHGKNVRNIGEQVKENREEHRKNSCFRRSGRLQICTYPLYSRRSALLYGFLPVDVP
jgi:hypothetical protein